LDEVIDRGRLQERAGRGDRGLQQKARPGRRALGVAEIFGGLGLVLPGLLHIRPGLTPLAAAGLIVIMIGAVAISVQTMGIGSATIPLVVGILLVFVALGRWRLAPIKSRR